MRSSVRALLAAILGFFMFGVAMAGDSASPAPDPAAGSAKESKAPEASASNASSPAAAAPAAPAPKSAAKPSPDKGAPPKGELFLGYSFVRFNTTTATGLLPASNVHEYFNLQGATLAMAFNINRWFGLVGDFAGYDVTNVPHGVVMHNYTMMGGPQFTCRKSNVMSPFVHVLIGYDHMASHISSIGPTGSAFFHQNYGVQGAFAAAAGGGLDITATRWLAFRAVQMDYLYTRLPSVVIFTGLPDSNNSHQHSLRVSGGLVFRFGGSPPPPPVAPNQPPVASCSADPTSVYVGSGDSVAVRAKASDPDNDPLNYTWSANGGAVQGTGPEVKWNSSGASQGVYTVTLLVDDGRGGVAKCSADVHVDPRPNRPPVMSCSADAGMVLIGKSIGITATASDPDNDPLTYTWTTNGGKIVGSGARIQVDTTGVAPGHYMVNGRVDDGRGGTADCTAAFDAEVPPEIKKLETRLALHSIYFATALPTPKDPNGGLIRSQQLNLISLATDFKTYLQSRPEAHLILEGHTDPRGSQAYNQALSERRVARTKSFLVQQGVPEASIETKGSGIETPMDNATVKQSVVQDPNLTAEERQRLLKNLPVIVLANSRRVDVTLNTTGQQSVRAFPFNAEDALSLIGGRTKPAPKKKAPAKPGPGKRPRARRAAQK